MIAGGGFTLMGEAVYLHKPMLSVPVGGQFEQVLNALYLEKLGYGLCAEELTEDRLREFLARTPRIREEPLRLLAGRQRDLLMKLESVLDLAARGVPAEAEG